MAKRNYENYYAQLRGRFPRKSSVCFWRNNLSLKDFKNTEDGKLVFEDVGEYKGLHVWMRMEIREGEMESIFHGERQAPVRFIGNPKHMGISVRMNRKAFPGELNGETNGIVYAFRMEGTYRELSFVEEKKRGECHGSLLSEDHASGMPGEGKE